MEEESRSFFQKLMGMFFVAIGIFLWMYAFFVNATGPNTFALNTITGAFLHATYGSNTITITWLSMDTPVLAIIDAWVLFINGTPVGKTWYVQNGQTVKIELISSSEYNQMVTSTLIIDSAFSTFRVTTETEAEANSDIDYTNIPTNLSITRKIQIIRIFWILKDLYTGDKQHEFFNSLMIMLQSRIYALWTPAYASDKRNALHYLYTLTDQYRNREEADTPDTPDVLWIVNGKYTAPNGKQYTIIYDSSRKQFTSTDFTPPTYSATLNDLKHIIDADNPIITITTDTKNRWWNISLDTIRQTSPYTAPNGKVFSFFKTSEGKYSSYAFTTETYFDALESAKKYIYTNNKK